jgi:hypothetical protein
MIIIKFKYIYIYMPLEPLTAIKLAKGLYDLPKTIQSVKDQIRSLDGTSALSSYRSNSLDYNIILIMLLRDLTMQMSEHTEGPLKSEYLKFSKTLTDSFLASSPASAASPAAAAAPAAAPAPAPAPASAAAPAAEGGFFGDFFGKAAEGGGKMTKKRRATKRRATKRRATKRRAKKRRATKRRAR